MTITERTKIGLYGALGALIVLIPVIFTTAIYAFKADTAYAATVAQVDVNTKILVSLGKIETALGLKEGSDK